jgi:hypothetical protein
MAVDADVVSCATVSVCGVPAGTPIAAAVRFSVTPWIAVVTVSLELVPAVPSMVNMASFADSVCVHGLVTDADAMVEESAALAPAVDVTPRLDSPASSVTVPTETLIVFDAPVADERKIKCAPSVPVTTVAVRPGLLDDELIALAIPLTVLFADVMSTLVDLSPTETFIVPVPSAVVAPNAADESVCALAICVTATE